MKFQTTCLLLILWLWPGPAVAGKGDPLHDQSPPLGDQEFSINFGFMDHSNGTLTLDSNFGLLTVDPASSSAFLSTGSGIAEFPLEPALFAAGFTPEAFDFSMAFPGTETSMFILSNSNGWHDVIPPCALVPCQRNWDPVDGSWIYTSILEDDYDIANPDPLLIQDHISFENWRQRRCDDFNESVIQSSISAAPAAVSCLAEGWASQLVCAGALIYQAHEIGKRNSAMVDCNTKYPGPGRWRESNLPRNYGQ